jgi:hypothetical protein
MAAAMMLQRDDATKPGGVAVEEQWLIIAREYSATSQTSRKRQLDWLFCR